MRALAPLEEISDGESTGGSIPFENKDETNEQQEPKYADATGGEDEEDEEDEGVYVATMNSIWTALTRTATSSRRSWAMISLKMYARSQRQLSDSQRRCADDAIGHTSASSEMEGIRRPGRSDNGTRREPCVCY